MSAVWLSLTFHSGNPSSRRIALPLSRMSSALSMLSRSVALVLSPICRYCAYLLFFSVSTALSEPRSSKKPSEPCASCLVAVSAALFFASASDRAAAFALSAVFFAASASLAACALSAAAFAASSEAFFASFMACSSFERSPVCDSRSATFLSAASFALLAASSRACASETACLSFSAWVFAAATACCASLTACCASDTFCLASETFFAASACLAGS